MPQLPLDHCSHWHVCFLTLSSKTKSTRMKLITIILIQFRQQFKRIFCDQFNFRVIKLSSPNINYIVIIGAALLYVCACLFATPIQDDTAATAICNVQDDNFTIISLFILHPSYSHVFGCFQLDTHCVLLLFSLKHGEYITFL